MKSRGNKMSKDKYSTARAEAYAERELNSLRKIMQRACDQRDDNMYNYEQGLLDTCAEFDRYGMLNGEDMGSYTFHGRNYCQNMSKYIKAKGISKGEYRELKHQLDVTRNLRRPFDKPANICYNKRADNLKEITR